MLLLTLPLWLLIVLGASVFAGWLYPSTRRRLGRAALTLWTLAVATVLLFQGTSLPHGAWAIAWYLRADARQTLEDLDLAFSRAQREEVVRRAMADSLEPFDGQYASPHDFVLPDGFTGLSDDRVVWVDRDGCGIEVFFRTITGFSPDPYGGFEFATPGCDPELDPHGSGQGRARDLGGGWYWIDAS